MRLRLLMAVLVAALVPSPGSAATVDYLKPMPGPIVRHYEPPPTPYSPGHRGIDIAAPVGTTVVASTSGIVHFAGQVGGRLFVSIDHADGIRTTYSFLSAVLVVRGETVGQGQPVARSGTGGTGDATPNLHFGALRGEEYLDPERLLIQSLRRNLWRAVRLAPVDG